MPKRVFQSDVDKKWAVGVFDNNGELQRGGSLKWYKTKEGAERGEVKMQKRLEAFATERRKKDLGY
jgi:hypothetical protein